MRTVRGKVKREELRKKRIGVLMGGSSSEREVSLRSGAAVVKALKGLGYSVVAIDAVGDLCSKLRKARADIAFIALHGGHGESGELQGMLEVMGIPYTGSGVLASAIAMDKEASKKVFAYHRIPVPDFAVLHRSAGKDKVRMPGRMPWVVKPAAEGSSVGVEIVRTRAGFQKALKSAFSYGDRVIVERYIRGKEVQIGVLNGRVLGGVEVRPSAEFYSYEAKYTAGLTQYIFPPELDRRTYARTGETALQAHLCLGCAGATRVDLIIDANNDPYVLEVNTIPGMTETSLLPKIARQAGLDFPDLLEEIMGGIGAA